MGGKIGTCGQITRIVFIAINALFLCVGIGITAGGSYLLVKGDALSFFTSSSHFSAAALLVVVGVFTMLITLLGIAGGLFLWRPVLVVYAVVISIIVILEVIATILAFVFRSKVEDTATDIANDAIMDYRDANDTNFDPNVNDAIDFVQESWDCCGWGGYADWINTEFYNSSGMMYPSSCECEMASGSGAGSAEPCITAPESGQPIWSTGCRDGVSNSLQKYAAAVGAIAIVFALVEVLVVLLSIGLIYAVTRNREYTTV